MDVVSLQAEAGKHILEIDQHTHTLQSIDYAYHQIYEGNAYVMTRAVDVANGLSTDILLVTGNTDLHVHLNATVISESEASFCLYEDTTTSNDGTTVTAYNRNRLSSNLPVTITKHTPTVTGVGTCIWTKHWGSGKDAGAEVRSENEFILKRSAKYLLRVTNATTNNNYISFLLNYYEHTDC